MLTANFYVDNLLNVVCSIVISSIQSVERLTTYITTLCQDQIEAIESLAEARDEGGVTNHRKRQTGNSAVNFGLETHFTIG